MKLILPSATHYEDHREYLADILTMNNLSARKFAQLYEKVISFSAITKLIKRSKDGGFEGSYSISLKTWVDLLTEMKVNSEDILLLTLLYLENDAHPIIGRNEANLFRTLKIIRDRYITCCNDLNLTPLNSMSVLVGKTFEHLSAFDQANIIRDLINMLGISLKRHEDAKQLSTLRELFRQLKLAFKSLRKR